MIKGRGQGQLINLDALLKLVREGTEEGGQIGKIRELQVAAERVRQGHRVGLGTGADVVDFSAKEAIQLKNVTSPDPSRVWENLEKAADQLSGGHGEVVPTDALGKTFRRTAEIIIDNPQNPLYGQTTRQLLKALQQQFSGNPVLQKNVDLVRIRAGERVYELGVSRLKNGDFKNINFNSAQPPRSEVQPTGSTAIASASSAEEKGQVAPTDKQPEIS